MTINFIAQLWTNLDLHLNLSVVNMLSIFIFQISCDVDLYLEITNER